MPTKRARQRTRQTKLNFSPASNTTPKPAKFTFVVSSDSDDGPSPSRVAKRQRMDAETERGIKLGLPVRQDKRGMFGSSDNEIIISSGSSSETSVDYGEAHAASPPKKPARKAKTSVLSDDDDEEEAQPKTKKSRAARKATTPKEDSSEPEVTVVRLKTTRRQTKATKISDKEEEEAHPKKNRRMAWQSSAPTETSDVPANEEEVAVVPRKDKRRQARQAEDSEEEVPRSKKSGRQAKRAAPAPADLSEQDSDDEVLITPSKPSRKRKKSATVSSDEEPRRAKKKGRHANQRASTPEDSDSEEQEEEANDEADELKEDLAFLQSSPPGFGSTQSKAKTSREKALEALRQRRAVNSDQPSSSAARRKPVVVDSDSESDLEIIPEEQEEASSEEHESDESAGEEEYSGTAQEALYGNADDDAFINDDDAPIGVPAEHAMPLQFSSLRNAKPRELFKFAIEWMVQKKINPAFPSEDEIYTMTFRKLDDEVKGLASSKYHSSVWTPEFTRAIRARPEIIISDLDAQTRAIMEPHCEACNRKSHSASFQVSFTGQPYHKETLEPLSANGSDSDSDSDSDSSSLSSTGSDVDLNGEKPTYDAQGEVIPPESRSFTLGSTCKANTQVAHTLYHWRYHLNTWVIDYLVRQGHCTPEQLVKRDKLSVRKRQKIANKIVDEMEKNGEVKKLHRMYKDQVNYAFETDNDYRKGYGRRG